MMRAISSRKRVCCPMPGSLKVRDANRQPLACVYSRENADVQMAKVLTGDDARRIASNIAKLPTLLGGSGT
jgi:hypothetical protein